MSLPLESMNLDFQDSKIYVLLLALGPLSVGEIIEVSEFTHEDVIKSIESLKNNGYISEIEGIASRYQALIPFSDLMISAESIIEKLESLSTQLDDHIAEKLNLVIGKLREESQKINEGLNAARETLNQAELKGEEESETKIARYALDVEQLTDNTKNDFKSLFETEEANLDSLVMSVKEVYTTQASNMGDIFQRLNENSKSKYDKGIDELKTQNTQKLEQQTNQVNEFINQAQNSLNQGIQNVHETMNNTGKELFDSIDTQNEILASSASGFVTRITEKITQVADQSQVAIKNSLQTFNNNLSQKIDSSKAQAIETLSSTKNDIKSHSNSTTQNLQQEISDILISTQNQIDEMFNQAKATLLQNINEAQTNLEKKLGSYSESVNIKLNSDIQEIILNTETTFNNLAQEGQSLNEKTVGEIDTNFGALISESKTNAEEIHITNRQELTKTVDIIKAEIRTQLENFNSILSPQIQFLKESLNKLQSDLQASQSKSGDEFMNVMNNLKEGIVQRNQELSEQINQESNNLSSNIEKFTEDLTNRLKEYSMQYNEKLINAADQGSEKLIAKTVELKEKTMAIVTEMAKTALAQLNATEQLVSTSIQSEITTMEAELRDYSSKFKEVTQRNDEMLKNYLSSLEKLSNLTKETPRPKVQTAPIFSKDATLAYIHGMFDRMKGGMTLLIPNLNEIPLDLILATKSHQRITVVTDIDPSTHVDLLKKLFQKPNVRVRSVDTSRFEGVVKNIAADRDGEEVIIGIIEDSGQTVSIASQADAFINLMGKLVIGGTFLAQSQEITRASVGM